MTRYYITQFNYVWSCDRATFERFLRIGAQGKGYSLGEIPGIRELKRQFYSEKTQLPLAWTYGQRTVQPLDWTQQDFESALEELLADGAVAPSGR